MATLIRPSLTATALTVALFMAALLFSSSSSAGTNHTVGGSAGWDVSSDLTSWSSSRTFFVNDTLVFLYGPNHDVIEVNRPDYDLCRMASPIHTFDDGETVVGLLRPGPRFFICGRNRYCNQGLKLRVDVQARPGPVMGPNPVHPSPVVQSPSSPNFNATTPIDDPTRQGHGRRPPPTPHFGARPPPPPPRRPFRPRYPPPPGDDEFAPEPSSGRKVMSSFSREGEFSVVSLFTGSSVIVALLGLGLACLASS